MKLTLDDLDTSSLRENLLSKEKLSEGVSIISAKSLKDAVLSRQIQLILSALLALGGSCLGLVPHYVGYVISTIYLTDNATSSRTAVQWATIAIAATVAKGIFGGLEHLRFALGGVLDPL